MKVSAIEITGSWSVVNIYVLLELPIMCWFWIENQGSEN